jgi:DNA repair exonuclease SbcCD ATPase subunit
VSRFFLTRLKVEGFRGINNETDPLELTFQPGAVNSVFAINGVGKSSIFEALCFAIKGTIPKLDALQAQERPQDYYCNRFHSQGVATIELELAADDGSGTVTVLVKRDASGGRLVSSPSGHPAPGHLLKGLDEDFTLLDYATFSRFIDSTPLDRGRSFASLLGLSSYSTFRQALQSVCETRSIQADLEINVLTTQASSGEQAVQSAIRKLQVAFEGLTATRLTDVARMPEYTAAVMAALAGIELVRPLVDGRDLAGVDFSAIKAAIKEAEGGEKRRELEQVIGALGELRALGEPTEADFQQEHDALGDLFNELDGLLAQTRGDAFKQLFEAAQNLVEAGWETPLACPLCDSTLADAIEKTVARQLGTFAEVGAKRAEIAKAVDQASWLARLKALEACTSLHIADEAKRGVAFQQNAATGAIKRADAEMAIVIRKQLDEARTAAAEAAEAARSTIEKALPASLVTLTEQVEFGRQFQEALADYNAKRGSLLTTRKRLQVRERWKDFITTAAGTFADAESELSRNTISVIDADYKALFAQIMGVNDVIPDLRRDAAKQDIHVQLSDFHGLSDLSARALLSESYRNALAISIFLAAAMKQSGAPRFVVLDDVTSSFDSGHQWNLMEAIRTKLQHPRNAGGLQFILLSHDGLLEKYFDKLGSTPDWHHQKLQGWPPLGAVTSHTQDANRLKATAIRLLDAGQVKEAEPLIRQYLEFKLLQIINKVRIPVPLDFAIKDHMKMVSNCLEAIGAAIELQKKARTIVLDAQQLADIDATLVPTLVANWVSHYETASGASLTPPVLKGVLQTIDNIAECFRYDDVSAGTVQRKWYRSLDAR